MRLDLGSGISLRHTVRNSSGEPTSATVVLTITEPDGTDHTPALAELSTGVYANVPVIADVAGIWTYRWDISGTVTDDYEGSIQVLDPAPPTYVTLDELKTYLGITDISRDAALASALSAASRAIDRWCSRRFWPDPVVSARTIRVRGRLFRDGAEYALIVPDIAEATGLDAGRTVTTDLVESGPITRLYSSYAWPETSVEITARWGWPYVPEEIAQATKLLASRYFRRKDSPEGVAGSADWGGIRVSRRDPDVDALIEPYVLPGVA